MIVSALIFTHIDILLTASSEHNKGCKKKGLLLKDFYHIHSSNAIKQGNHLWQYILLEHLKWNYVMGICSADVSKKNTYQSFNLWDDLY